MHRLEGALSSQPQQSSTTSPTSAVSPETRLGLCRSSKSTGAVFLFNLAIYTLKDGGAFSKATHAGRPMERAGIQAVAQLLSGAG